MMLRIPLFSLLMACVLGLSTACQRSAGAITAPVVAASDAPPRAIRFGSGGGFVGTTTTYTIYATGRLERRRGAPADTARPAAILTSPPPGPVARCFQAFDALPNDSLTLREPGNMYYFLDGQTAAGRRVALTWGRSGALISPAARALHRDLTALVPLTD